MIVHIIGGKTLEQIMQEDWIGLILVGLGTLFILGEILVDIKGLFAILGISSIVFYFYAFLPTPGSFALMLLIYFIGILLILIDGKLINDGTLATLGFAGMILSIVITAPNFFAGLYAIIGLILGAFGAFLFLKILPPRNMWNKIALKDRLTSEAGYTTVNRDHEKLIGKTGITLTDLRPVGTITIEDKDYSAISDGQWIAKNTKVTVLAVDGTRILVKEA